MELKKVLDTAPQRIAELETIVSEKRTILDQKKHMLLVERAIVLTGYSEKARNMAVLEALVEQSTAVSKAEADVIKAQADLRMAEIDKNEWENAFASARKLFSQNITVGDIHFRGESTAHTEQ